jgi:D-glycero-D-manno-heptose 1,7-bisphosphate phosphatase
MRAVFLDRDGVLNENVWYADTRKWEAPREVAAFRLKPGVIPALLRLRNAGYRFFLVSNQPNVAKGKSSVAALPAMHARLLGELRSAALRFEEAYYCTHHPVHTGPCLCRKPSPYFLQEAARVYGVQLADSWMVGDRVSDMACGRAAGVRTAWVNTGQEPDTPAPEQVDVSGPDLAEVVERMLCEQP